MMKKLLFILGICLLSAPVVYAEGESLKYQYTKAFIESLEWVKASEDKIDETDLDYTKYESDAKMAYQYIENLAKATDDLKKAMDKISSYMQNLYFFDPPSAVLSSITSNKKVKEVYKIN